jgi:pimeloyl-ACP methyl ester carboxylesterase
LVIPGAGTSDTATALIRGVLSAHGHSVHGWDLGTNVGYRQGPRQRIALDERFVALHQQAGRPVALVGFSLGGVYARELARRHPEATRLVITVSSPFRPIEPAGIAAVPVPTTCLYSKDDRVARWETCIDPIDDMHENIEFSGPHLMITTHPAVTAVVVDRLAQPDGTWKPFRPNLTNWLLFPAGAAGAQQ